MKRNMMRVRWEIDVDARTAREAARKALEIQRDPGSIATVFDVTYKGKTVRVDLSLLPGRASRKA
jgi:hypothetical protein